MQGLRRSCLMQLLLWAAVVAIFYAHARAMGRGGGETWGVATLCGLGAAMALIAASSTVRTWRELRTLARSAREAAPRDGAWTVAAGAIRCASPVRAPVSGELVAMYEYSVSRDERIGRSTSLVIWFDGKALAPSTIATPHGAVRLLTVPALEVEAEAVDHRRAVANLRAHLRDAVFEKRDTARQRTSALEREWTDDDGVFRTDRRHSSADVDLVDRFLIEERHLAPGDAVCAFGVYSAKKRALIPDGRWGRPSRITGGTIEQVSRSLRGRVFRYAIVALVLGAASIAGWLAYLSQPVSG